MKFRPGKIKSIKHASSAASGNEATVKGFVRRGSAETVKASGKIKRAMQGKKS